MVKKMMGLFKMRSIPVLVEDEHVASYAKENAYMLKTIFAKAHGSDNLGEVQVTYRQVIIRQ